MWRLSTIARSFVVAFVVLTSAYGGSALVASPRAAALCCNSNEECGAEEVCCPADAVGEATECSGAAPNYCRTACVPSGL